MKVEFLGVGEAFAPELGNTALIVHGTSTTLLVDCGYAIPREYFNRGYHPDLVDGIYLTHCHADHTFGLPAVLTRLYQDGRKRALNILGQPGTREMVVKIVDLAYPGIRDHFGYELKFIETVKPITFGGFNLAFAETKHGARNYAIKISEGRSVLGISGDGECTAESIALFNDCTALIHESFRLSELKWGHSSAQQVVDFARTIKNLRKVAFVHIDRTERGKVDREMLELASGLHFQLSIPVPGEVWEI